MMHQPFDMYGNVQHFQLCNIYAQKLGAIVCYPNVPNNRRKKERKKERKKGPLFTIGNRIYIKASF